MSQSLSTIDAKRMGTWKQLQKLTLCRQLLQQCCDEFSTQHDVQIAIDDRSFTSAYFSWLDVVSFNADYRNQNPLDYFHFVSGVMLRDLLRAKVLQVSTHAAAPVRPEPGTIGQWWPTGYVLTYFCIATLKKVAREECAVEVQTTDTLGEPTAWQSFRENLIEEPGLAIAFFDKFMGVEPNWREPDQAFNRPAAANARKNVT